MDFLHVFFIVGLTWRLVNFFASTIAATLSLERQLSQAPTYNIGDVIGATITTVWWGVAFVCFWL